MIIEHRTYQLQTSMVGPYFELFGEAGIALQERYVAPCVGHYVTEIGPHSQIVALWQHASFESRLQGRQRLQQDPQWRALIERVSPLIRSIEIKLLVRSPVWQNGMQAAANA